MASLNSSDEYFASPRDSRTSCRRSSTATTAVFTTLFARKKCVHPGQQLATSRGDVSWIPHCGQLDVE